MPPQAFAKTLDRSPHSSVAGDGLVHRALIARGQGPVLAGVAALALAGLVACSGARPFSTKPVLWEDDDRRPFTPKPEESYVPLYWDGADHIPGQFPLRIHLLEGEPLRVVGLARPEEDHPSPD